MIYSIFYVWAVAIVLGLVCFGRREGQLEQGGRFALGQAVALVPRILLALVAANFLASLIPGDMISAWAGAESGLQGIAIASLAGALIPGGPVITFPLAAVLMDAGAGVPQVVAFISSWSIFAIHRILLYELNLAGGRFTALRLVLGIPVPILAGLLAGLISGGLAP